MLSGYLYVLTGDSNFKVGLAEGAQGIAQCACGLLAGWAADRFRRRTVCRVACVTGVVASLGLILAIAVSDVSARARFDYVTVGLAAFGAYQGVWSTALETLFADSTTRGAQRAEATSQKFMLTLLATTAGPAPSRTRPRRRRRSPRPWRRRRCCAASPRSIFLSLIHI